jgi:hypothetical protein
VTELFSMNTFPCVGPIRVIWREGTWWCQLGLVQGYPVLRLYDGDILEMEHEIMPGTISETAEAMRRAVLRYVSIEPAVHKPDAPPDEAP